MPPAEDEASHPSRRRLWDVIAPFASLRLSPREIRAALEFATGASADLGDIVAELHNARRAHRLPAPTLEERQHARTYSSFASARTIAAQVPLVLDAAALTLLRSHDPWPDTRMAWIDRTEALHRDLLVTPEAWHWQVVGILHDFCGQPLGVLAHEASLRAERRLLAEAEDAVLATIFAGRPELIPSSAHERRFLLVCYALRAQSPRGRSRSPLVGLPAGYELQDPTIRRRLAAQMTAVTSGAPLPRLAGRRQPAAAPSPPAPSPPAPVEPPVPAVRPCDPSAEMVALPRRARMPPDTSPPRVARCTHCGGTPFYDAEEGRWVCIMCGRGARDLAARG